MGIIRTSAGNYYLLGEKFKQLNLINPVLGEFIERSSKGLSIDQLKKEHPYYYKFYNFLKIKGWLDKKEVKNGNLYHTAETVKNRLFNCRSIAFEATERCNLNCTYCCYGDLYSKGKNRGSSDFQYQKAIVFLNYMFESDLAKEYRKIQEFNISFYGGEPLLNVGFIKKVVLYAKELSVRHGLDCTFGLTTNGVLLDKHIDYLVQNEFEILISLDGDESSSSYRVNKSGDEIYETVFRNSKNLKERYPDYFISKVNFSAVLHNRNRYNEVLDYFAKEFDIKEPMIASISTYGSDSEKIENFKPFVNSEVNNIGNNLANSNQEKFFSSPVFKEVRKLVHNFSNNRYLKINHLLFENFGSPKNNYVYTGTCQPFQIRTFITVNGDIHTCERIDFKHTLGRVEEQGVSINFKNIAHKYREIFKEYFSLCSICGNYQSCMKCVLQLDGEGTCDEFKSEKEFHNQIREALELLENYPEFYYRSFREQAK